jgi:hypothetical protein
MTSLSFAYGTRGAGGSNFVAIHNDMEIVVETLLLHHPRPLKNEFCTKDQRPSDI